MYSAVFCLLDHEGCLAVISTSNEPISHLLSDINKVQVGDEAGLNLPKFHRRKLLPFMFSATQIFKNCTSA